MKKHIFKKAVSILSASQYKTRLIECHKNIEIANDYESKVKELNPCYTLVIKIDRPFHE